MATHRSDSTLWILVCSGHNGEDLRRCRFGKSSRRQMGHVLFPLPPCAGLETQREIHSDPMMLYHSISYYTIKEDYITTYCEHGSLTGRSMTPLLAQGVVP